jgi:hypothetical protein
MKVYLIILLIYFNCIVSQLSNNESLLVFNILYKGLFTAKLGKTKNQINESNSDILVKTDLWTRDIDYSLSANIIIWIEDTSDYFTFYAIPINKR